MQIEIKMSLDNASYDDANRSGVLAVEVINDIKRALTARPSMDFDTIPVRDANGNMVGEITLSGEWGE